VIQSGDHCGEGRAHQGPPLGVWAAVGLGLLAALLAIAYSLLYTRAFNLPYRIVHDPGLHWGYRTPTDFWCIAQMAGYVANGALGYVYESCSTSPALPLGAILLAPLVAVGQAMGLTSPPAPEPSMWLLLGPVAMLVAIPLLLAVQAPPGVRLGRPVPVLVAAALLAFVPTGAMYGHVEDLLAIALVLWAIGPVRAGRWLWAGLLLGLAVAAKQWALLTLPVLLAAAPRGTRLRTLAVAGVLPGALGGLALAVDWAHAAPLLLHPPTFPAYGQPAPWVDTAGPTAATTPFRVAAVLLALAAGWGVHRRLRRGQAGQPVDALGLTLAGLGIALLARAMLEPVLHAYYLSPGLCLLLLHERHTTGRVRATLAIGGTLLLWCSVHGDPVLWWPVALLLAVLVAARAALQVAGLQARPAGGDDKARRPTPTAASWQEVAGQVTLRSPRAGARESGFSLVELAVVVAIIAILIAVATPVFLGARKRSQDASAQTTLGYALGAERSYYADADEYTTDTTALDRELQQAVTWVTGTPAANGKEVSVTVDDIGPAQAEQGQLVCLVAVSASGNTFTVKDMSKGANAGTWYRRGAASGCDTSVTGYGRDWSG
jgi:type IV pilus assembly protein PilA